MTFKFKNLLYGVALFAGFALASPSAIAVEFNDFQVDPTYGDVLADPPDVLEGDSAIFTADKIIGNYVEAIVFNTDGTFDVRLRWVVSAFVADDGTSPLDAGETGVGVTYNLYALYEGTGTFSTDEFGVTTFVTAAGDGFFELYLDLRDPRTTFDFSTSSGLTYANIFDRSSDVDDVLLAQGQPGAGSGRLDPASCVSEGINCGSFGTSVSLLLTAQGGSFFIDPVPFYNLSFQSGQLNNFDLTGEQIINGSLDAVFASVPEPATLTLMGMALAGLGLALRRRRLT